MVRRQYHETHVNGKPMDILSLKEWSPYAVGIAIGILNCIGLIISDRFIGCSTAFSRTSGMIERLFRGSKVNEKLYYRKFVPEIDWEWMLVPGIACGAWLSAYLSGDLKIVTVPALWAKAFGDSTLLRFSTALLGGILMGLGARWAGGCTSGHGISGTIQLAVSSWTAVLCFFVSGIITAFLLFHFF